jgi:LysM repeat protein
MAAHSPARWLAPLALAGALVAGVWVVSSSTGGDSSSSNRATESAPAQKTSTTARRKRGRTDQAQQPRTYTVQSGDILSTVAEKTGVPVERLQQLNPGLDANALSIGQKIKLSDTP